MEHQQLVIGAGPLGLAVAKALAEAGIPYAQAETTDHVGGNWAHGVYETAHIISSKKTTEYPDWPMPADYPDFPSASQMWEYYERFADAHGLRPAIRFRTEVTAVRYRPDRLWDVTFGTGETETFKGVVVCNGHHWSRELPAWTAGYAGELLHSKDYRRPDQLKDRRVLVVGGGNSGCDIVSEAARVGTLAAWSLRRGYWFMPKTMFGVPTVELLRGWMPVPLQRVAIRSLLRLTVGPYSSYGLPEPEHRLFEAHPSISTEALHYLKHGRIAVRPDVTSADGTRIRFADGREETFDTVVCATGFKVDFPFLPEGMVPVVGKTAQLYGGMLRPEYRNLYVFGTAQARYGVGPLVRPGAQLLARWIRIQDEIGPNLGEVMRRLGEKPPSGHLVDPHAVLRKIWMSAHVYEPIIRRAGRRMTAADPTPDRHPRTH